MRAMRVYTYVSIRKATRYRHGSSSDFLQGAGARSVFFVWVVRYADLVQKFKQHGRSTG